MEHTEQVQERRILYYIQILTYDISVDLLEHTEQVQERRILYYIQKLTYDISVDLLEHICRFIGTGFQNNTEPIFTINIKKENILKNVEENFLTRAISDF